MFVYSIDDSVTIDMMNKHLVSNGIKGENYGRCLLKMLFILRIKYILMLSMIKYM